MSVYAESALKRHENAAVKSDTFVALWPKKYDVLGVNVSAITYESGLKAAAAAIRARVPFCWTHLAVHGVVEGSRDPDLRAMLNNFDVVAPDGQPVRRALNWLYMHDLPSNCRGPEMIVRFCQYAVQNRIKVYLYGSTEEVVERLRDNLVARHPGLQIVGAEPSAFRELTPEEDAALVDRINESGAQLVFIGLGCPLQERFAYAHRARVKAGLICLGAAFDFHAGTKKMAPDWMIALSLEWLFRLCQEPRRLFRRYLTTNSVFVFKLLMALAGYRNRAEAVK